MKRILLYIIFSIGLLGSLGNFTVEGKECSREISGNKGIGNSIINPYKGKSKDILLKSKKSYEKLIKEHKVKLSDFKKDPIGNTSPLKLKEFMKDNPSKEVLSQRAKGRIPALEKQIQKQIKELQKIIEALE